MTAQAGQSDADRLRDEAIEIMREFAKEIDKMLRERRLDDVAMYAFRFAGRAEAHLEWFDRAAAKEADS